MTKLKKKTAAADETATKLIEIANVYDQLLADALRPTANETAEAVADLDDLFLNEVAQKLEITGDIDADVVFDDLAVDDAERYTHAANVIADALGC